MVVILKILFLVYLATLIVPITIVIGISGIILSLFSKKLAHYAEKVYFNIILFLTFTSVKVVGIENIKKGNKYVIISNHQSAFDIIVLSAKIPFVISWVSKESVFNIPVIGWFMKAMGYISLPRDNLKESVLTVKSKTKSIFGSPTIFPEGTRSSDGKLQKFKKGFVLMAQNTGLDILPVVIKGTIDIMRKGSLLITPFRKVEIKILPPIPNHDAVNDKDIIDKVMEIYRKELN
ncbi:MAG: 1-acyl-sn-glycerol-3-phosphate acyltransferase [Brevinematales bacterium]|nr:1-acyl-sn-glycerol-3-phosphate acyltransferase [Brevinematales bacterium]